MKKIIAWTAAWALHCIGHVCFLICDNIDFLSPVFFRPYQELMHWSLMVNNWGGADFWIPLEEDDD